MNQSLILLIVTSVILCGCTATTLNIPQTRVNLTTTNSGAGIERPSPTTTEDVTAIKKLFAANAAALSAGDLDALAKLYEPDAILLPPNSRALTGWEAIRSKLERELEGVKVAATIEVVEVCIADSWAFARGTYRMVTTPKGGGEQAVTTGSWLDILRRQPDSSWKIARSTWSTED